MLSNHKYVYYFHTSIIPIWGRMMIIECLQHNNFTSNVFCYLLVEMEWINIDLKYTKGHNFFLSIGDMIRYDEYYLYKYPLKYCWIIFHQMIDNAYVSRNWFYMFILIRFTCIFLCWRYLSKASRVTISDQWILCFNLCSIKRS